MPVICLQLGNLSLNLLCLTTCHEGGMIKHQIWNALFLLKFAQKLMSNSLKTEVLAFPPFPFFGGKIN